MRFTTSNIQFSIKILKSNNLESYILVGNVTLKKSSYLSTRIRLCRLEKLLCLTKIFIKPDTEKKIDLNAVAKKKNSLK